MSSASRAPFSVADESMVATASPHEPAMVLSPSPSRLQPSSITPGGGTTTVPPSLVIQNSAMDTGSGTPGGHGGIAGSVAAGSEAPGLMPGGLECGDPSY
jgi:hypothetical protein